MRYLVISDLHENYVGLVDMLDLATEAGGYEGIWFLGDALGHCDGNQCEAKACLSLLQEKNALCIIGNWEGWLNHPEWDEDDDHHDQKKHKPTLQYLRQTLPTEFLTQIKSWDWLVEQGAFTLTHGCPYRRYAGLDNYEPWETYLRPIDTGEITRIFMLDKITTDHLIVGHTHQPGYFHYNGMQAVWHPLTSEMINQDISMDPYGGRYVLNPGSLSYNQSSLFPEPTALLLDTETRIFRFLTLKGTNT